MNSQEIKDLKKEADKRWAEQEAQRKKELTLKKLTMRKDEVDIRELSSADFRQLIFRYIADDEQRTKVMNINLSIIVLLLEAICKETGIEFEKILNEAVNDPKAEKENENWGKMSEQEKQAIKQLLQK